MVIFLLTELALVLLGIALIIAGMSLCVIGLVAYWATQNVWLALGWIVGGLFAMWLGVQSLYFMRYRQQQRQLRRAA